jgi:hypothetical protein
VAVTSLIIAVAVAALMTLPMNPASAGRIDPPGRQANDCVHPSGVSFNELFAVPEQFWNFICTDLSAGEHWRPTAAWTFAEGADAIYPPGYAPLYANPLDDWLAKVVTIKMVIDGGTNREKTYFYSPAEAVRTDVRIAQLNPSFPDLPTAFLIPRMAPLSPGHHTHEMIVVLSAQQCDGLTTDEAAICAPAGEFSLFQRATDVATPELVNGG